LIKTGRNTVYITIAFFVLLLAGMVFAVCVGKYPVTPAESLGILLGKPDGVSDMTRNVVMRLRVPRILASALVGAALSISGAAYQGVFNNPLVSPEYLGVTSGACVGAAIGILMSVGGVYVSVFAFAGGVLAMLLTMFIPVVMRNTSNIFLVLSGVIVGSAMSSILGFIKYVADPNTQLASIVYWTMGSFSYVTYNELIVLMPVIILPAVTLLLISWWIDVLSMGESAARALGANVSLIRGITLGCATLLTASTVSVSGTIGWVGLIIPHFCRLMIGPSNRRLLPLAAVMGGLFMLIVDTLTRTIGVTEMPVSILTGVIGAPFYCWLLYTQRKELL